MASKHFPPTRLINVPQINHLVYTTRWKHMMKVGFKCGCVLRSRVEATMFFMIEAFEFTKCFVSILGVLNFISVLWRLWWEVGGL